MTQYLHNGERMVVEVVPPIVQRLKELRLELQLQNTFRFHASSVLIIYESVSELSNAESSSKCRSKEDSDKGSAVPNTVANSSCQGSVDGVNPHSENDFQGSKPYHCSVHMIDFAHSTFEGFLEDKTVYHGPDNDCLYAIDNLVTVLNDIWKNSQTTT